ncbi:MAG: S-layer homology domain-containing protein [Oscillospiraceae bacterium]|nr:S-layer homology domain-containing protein [Oscillospiraceae bacterium]
MKSQEGPFLVGHPEGATYYLNETAVPLVATFEYDSAGSHGQVSNTVPIKVQWYWSDTNSNTSRTNGLGETTVPYANKIDHKAEHTPATNALGVKYYYAVLTYATPQPQIYSYKATKENNPEDIAKENITAADIVISIVISPPPPTPTPPPPEVVTNPARIEVIAVPTPAPEQSFDVKKVDQDDKPLAGAVFALDPQDGRDEQDVIARTREATSAANGTAKFTAADGIYILTEKKAPDGYEGSDDEYYIVITANGIFIGLPDSQGVEPYETLTFVNEEIATTTPTPTPTATPTPTPAPSAAEQTFEVRKADGSNAPLAGAVFSLVPDGSRTQGASVTSHDATTGANGIATFTAAPGYYILGEKQAPAGYNASPDKYYIRITTNGVFIVDPDTDESNAYATVTFVNLPIPRLDKVNHFAFMQGYPEGDFRPDNNMTRAEAVVMFSRLLSESMDLNTDYRNSYYPDVEHTNPSMNIPWYANQVCYMHSLGVLTDYSRDTRFRPDEPVTRAEFATLASHFDKIELVDTNNFSDVTNSHWAIKYINSAAENGWITGYPDGTFRPESNITRAEVVTLVGRMLDRYADDEYIAANRNSLPRNYWDLTTDFWGYLMVMEASIGHEYTKDSMGKEHWTSTYR